MYHFPDYIKLLLFVNDNDWQKKLTERLLLLNTVNSSDLVCRKVGWNCLDGKGSSPFPVMHNTSTYIMYGACNAAKSLHLCWLVNWFISWSIRDEGTYQTCESRVDSLVACKQSRLQRKFGSRAGKKDRVRKYSPYSSLCPCRILSTSFTCLHRQNFPQNDTSKPASRLTPWS